MMLANGGFYYDELMTYQINEIAGPVLAAQRDALLRCANAGEDW